MLKSVTFLAFVCTTPLSIITAAELKSSLYKPPAYQLQLEEFIGKREEPIAVKQFVYESLQIIESLQADDLSIIKKKEYSEQFNDRLPTIAMIRLVGISENLPVDFDCLHKLLDKIYAELPDDPPHSREEMLEEFYQVTIFERDTILIDMLVDYYHSALASYLTNEEASRLLEILPIPSERNDDLADDLEDRLHDLWENPGQLSVVNECLRTILQKKLLPQEAPEYIIYLINRILIEKCRQQTWGSHRQGKQILSNVNIVLIKSVNFIQKLYIIHLPLFLIYVKELPIVLPLDVLLFSACFYQKIIVKCYPTNFDKLLPFSDLIFDPLLLCGKIMAMQYAMMCNKNLSPDASPYCPEKLLYYVLLSFLLPYPFKKDKVILSRLANRIDQIYRSSLEQTDKDLTTCLYHDAALIAVVSDLYSILLPKEIAGLIKDYTISRETVQLYKQLLPTISTKQYTNTPCIIYTCCIALTVLSLICCIPFL